LLEFSKRDLGELALRTYCFRVIVIKKNKIYICRFHLFLGIVKQI
jgi:hypothetical protein